MVDGLTRRKHLTAAEDHPEISVTEQLVMLVKNAREGADRRGIPFELDMDMFLERWVGVERSPQTGIPFDNRKGRWLPFRRSLERTCNWEGYTALNSIVVTNIENKGKGPWSLEEWDRMCLARAAVLGWGPKER